MESLAENVSASIWFNQRKEIESQKKDKQETLSELHKGCRESSPKWRTCCFRMAQTLSLVKQGTAVSQASRSGFSWIHHVMDEAPAKPFSWSAIIKVPAHFTYNLSRQLCESNASKAQFSQTLKENDSQEHTNMPHPTPLPRLHALAPRLRHVSIEAGIRVVGGEAWQCCRQLRIVRMPTSVVRTAPGCVEFGYKAFAERSSLQWVHASEGVANQFCSSTKFGHYLFRDCINLATFVLQEISHQQESQARVEARELSQGCLSSTGIATLKLTRDFQVLGAHACDNCTLLKKVDISNTKIEEIQEFTFVHCTSLCEIRLPYTLHTIRVKAFMNSAALPELAIPPSLHYIASRAFLDCTALRRLVKLPGRHQ